MTSSNVLFIFKSTYYPDFRQKILSLMSLPNGTTQTIEFDKKYLSDEVIGLKEVKDTLALVIFLDYSLPVPQFQPLRYCKIVEIVKPTDGVTYQIRLGMQDFVIPNDANFSDKTYEFIKNENLLDIKPNKDEYLTKLVISGSSLITDIVNTGSSQQEVWEQIVTTLKNANTIQRLKNQEQFKDSIFFRAKILSRSELEQALIPKNYTYELNQGKQYALMISVHNPIIQASSKTVKVDFDKKSISHVGSQDLHLPLGQRKYTKYFDFHTKETITEANSEILVEQTEDDFQSPSIKLPYKLQSKLVTIIILGLSLFFGILLLGIGSALSDDIAKYLATTGIQVETSLVKLIFVIAGTALSAPPIIWLEIKKRLL